MFVYEIIYFLIFALYCIVDLRFRTVSSICIFFAGALLLSVGLDSNPNLVHYPGARVGGCQVN